jgi:hypothetical protein
MIKLLVIIFVLLQFLVQSRRETLIHCLLICLDVYRFLGTPFFHSMIARSHSFTSDIFVLIDPETILLHDFISTLNYAYELDHDWLLVSSSRNISHFPFYLEEDGKHWRKGNGKWVRTQEVQKNVFQIES